MKLNSKSASAFAAGLTRSELVVVAHAYATGVPFEDTYNELLPQSQAEHLPEYLRTLRGLLQRRAMTSEEIAAKMNVTNDSVNTYVSKLRKAGVRVSRDFRYGKTKYWIDK